MHTRLHAWQGKSYGALEMLISTHALPLTLFRTLSRLGIRVANVEGHDLWSWFLLAGCSDSPDLNIHPAYRLAATYATFSRDEQRPSYRLRPRCRYRMGYEPYLLALCNLSSTPQQLGMVDELATKNHHICRARCCVI